MQINDGRVVSNFIIQALKNEKITVYGDGMQTRSFCYVDDLVEGMVKMMEQEKFNGPLNLGNPTDSSNKTCKRIYSLTKSESEIVYEPLPIDDPKMRCPDIDLAKKN